MASFFHSLDTKGGLDHWGLVVFFDCTCLRVLFACFGTLLYLHTLHSLHTLLPLGHITLFLAWHSSGTRKGSF